MLKQLLLISFILIFAFSCKPRSPSNSAIPNPRSSNNCQTVQHQGGETKICGHPQRIVVLNPKMLDILLSLGVQPIGYAEIFSDRWGDFDQPGQQIPYLGNQITQPIANLGTSGQPSLEAIARLQPDLILGDSAGNQEEYSQLAKIAPTLLFDYVGHDKWQEPLQIVANVLGRTVQAQAVIDRYQQQLDSARQTFAPIVKSYPSVLMVASEQLTQSVDLVTSVDFCGGLLENLGFQLVARSQTEPNSITQPISLEMLPQIEADIVVVQGHNFAGLNQVKTVSNFEDDQLRLVQQDWRTNPIAQSLTASRGDRIYFIPTYLCRGIPSPIGSQLVLEHLRTQFSPLITEANQK